jgi:hypothetical protein
MPNNSPLAEVDIDLHPQAVQKARKCINDFAITLIMQAKTLAFSKKADLVLTTHIDEALEMLNTKKRESWYREIAIIIGSAFFGAFIQGFVSELSSGNAFLIASYTVMGFAGIFMVFWGLRR